MPLGGATLPGPAATPRNARWVHESPTERMKEERLSLRYHNPVAIHFGAGAIAELPAMLGGRRAALVVFPEAEGLGLTGRLRTLLGSSLAAVEDRIEPTPTSPTLPRCTSGSGAITPPWKS